MEDDVPRVGRRYNIRSFNDLSSEELALAQAAYSLVDGGLYDIADPPFNTLTFYCLFLDALELMAEAYRQNSSRCAE